MNEDESSGERLPAAHPDFTRHFTSGFYDADDFRNDEVPPFGTDEGYDDVHEWAGRLDLLERRPTLRYMIGVEADRLIAGYRRSDNPDGDDGIISLGFTLLRYTGQIDAEGRAWLLEAFRRQDQRYPKREYPTMLHDLSTFGPPSKRKNAPRQSPLPWLDIRYGGGDRSIDNGADR